MSDAFGREIHISRAGLRLGESAFSRVGHFRTFSDTAGLAALAELHTYSILKEPRPACTTRRRYERARTALAATSP
jgi:hypothetical protein